MASDAETITASIAALNEHVRGLRAQNADKETITTEMKKLGELKKRLGQLAGSAREDPKKGRLVLKTPKMAVRERIFSTLTRVFKTHGGVTIDTPVFELKEILTGKYGEDRQLIYDLQDQGGEVCSLRYDLTVPFARFLAMNGTTYPTIKRYHIAKVYRRDAPAMTKGRMREFYQFVSLRDLFHKRQPLKLRRDPHFTIKINHRKILDGIFGLCGVPMEKVRAISSAVDKLDKLPWTDVRREMVDEKGLDRDVADKIGEYVKLKGGPELLSQFRSSPLAENKSAVAGMDDMELLFKYLDVFGITDKVLFVPHLKTHMSFDLSLARGLDYYTGLIYEAVVEGSAPPSAFNASAIPTPASSAPAPQPASKPKPSKKPKPASTDAGDEEVDESQVGLGSIAAGGRCDELVGMFSAAAAGAGGKGAQIPCVGVSVGVERVFSILMQREKEKGTAAGAAKGRSKATEVYVVSVGEGLVEERMRLAKDLWDAGIKAEFMHKLKPKLQRQFEVLEKEQISYVLLIGPDEVKEGMVNVKTQLSAGGEAAGTEEKIPRAEVIEWLKNG
ncbi:Cytoplasmic and mitochondrial histidine tRNA synthetase [Ceratobasidium sp. 414]|nr:Cytoplasmic and mitochondrial histidine tRNA synthetase [Ceratobasidium sp. 414]